MILIDYQSKEVRLMEWLILIPVLVITTVIWAAINRDSNGPSHCMGCGACDKTGACVLRRRDDPK